MVHVIFSGILVDMATDVESGGGQDISASLFRDLKLKRRRLQDLLAVDSETDGSGNGTGIEADLQSNTSTESSESGYVSQWDISSVNGRDQQKTDFQDVQEKEVKMGAAGNLLFMPPPYRNDLAKGMHIGFAYIGVPPTGGEAVGENNPESFGSEFIQNSLKMGLVPMLAPISGFLPMTSMGLTGMSVTNEQNSKAGIQPLFLTTMPGGFVFTSKGPVPVMSTGYPAKESKTCNKRDQKQSFSMSGTDDDVDSRVSSEPPYKKHMAKENETEFINHYTNGSFVYLGHMPGKAQDRQKVDSQVNQTADKTGDLSDMLSSMAYYNSQPMTCGICQDKATGLHYGIITCEG